MLRFLYDYNDFTQFAKYMYNFFLNCMFKNSSHFNSINVTPFILRRWHIVYAACGTVWSRSGGVSVGVCGCVWVCVCVCVGVCVCVCGCVYVCVSIVWLQIEGIKWVQF